VRGTASLFVPPSPGGIREDLNPVDVPVGELIDSSNWLASQSVGRPRFGYTQIDEQLTPAMELEDGVEFQLEDGTALLLEEMSPAA